MSKILFSLLVFLAIATTVGPVRSAEAPSFDCAKAHHVEEKLICSDERLAHADRSLSGFYNVLLSVMTGTGRDGEKQDQRRWISTRNMLCGIRPDLVITDENRKIFVKCFIDQYGERGVHFIERAHNLTIDERTFEHLKADADTGNIDAEAFIGAVTAHWSDDPALSDSIRKILRKRTEPAQSEIWLKKALDAGQLMARRDFDAAIGAEDPSPDLNICNGKDEERSGDEVKRLLPLVDLDETSADLIWFTCTDPSDSKHLIVGTNVGWAGGQVYSIHLDGKQGESKPIMKGANALEGNNSALIALPSKSKTPILILQGDILHHGNHSQWLGTLNITTGVYSELIAASTDNDTSMQDGELESSESCFGNDKQLRGTELGIPHTELRSDGLHDLVVDFQTSYCDKKSKTGLRFTNERVRFSPAQAGFERVN